MSPRGMNYLTNLLTLLGVAMILVGATMWWRQTRIEAALLTQSETVLSVEMSEPPTLPDFNAGSERPEPTHELPTVTPDATATASAALTATAQPTAEPTAEPTVEATPTIDPFPPAAVVPSRIRAPAINLDVEVVEMGWAVKQDANGNTYSEWIVPGHAAGWHKNSALPGHGSNTVLSGHHNVEGEVFRYLVNLEPGNEVELEAGGMTYHYVVEEKLIVKEKGEPIEVRRQNNRYIEATEDERLTLVSCWPYETNTHRVIVIARPVLESAETGAADGVQ